MDVQTKGQSRGSQLIMSQNSLFGVRGVKGDQFVDKTPEFPPKFVTLIVPKRAERLDERKTAWEMIWEDNQILVGNAFYLPASGREQKTNRKLKCDTVTSSLMEL